MLTGQRGTHPEPPADNLETPWKCRHCQAGTTEGGSQDWAHRLSLYGQELPTSISAAHREENLKLSACGTVNLPQAASLPFLYPTVTLARVAPWTPELWSSTDPPCFLAFPSSSSVSPNERVAIVHPQPVAMASKYITLISAEGFEFVVLRAAAMVSPFIKGMLDERSQFAEAKAARCHFPEMR